MRGFISTVKCYCKRAKRRVAAVIGAATVMTATMVSTAFAVSPTPVPLDLTEISSAVTSQVTVGQVVAVIAACIAGSMAFVVLWFGARKLTKAIVVAFKTGKIHL